MDTLTPLPPDQLAKFRADLEDAAVEVCMANGMDPRECVAEAIAVSGCGRFSLSFNYWNLPGSGSRGYFFAVAAPRDENIANGGVKPMVQQRAKFGSAREAVTAWCAANRGK